MQQIFSFAKLSWEDHQIQETVKAADISRIAKKGEGQYIRSGLVGDWKEQLSEAELAMCQEIAGDQLARLGYTASN